MNIKLVLGKEERSMATDNGVPRVGDTVEFTSKQLAKVIDVRWNLHGAEPHYRKGFITHEAVVTLLVEPKKAKRR